MEMESLEEEEQEMESSEEQMEMESLEDEEEEMKLSEEESLEEKKMDTNVLQMYSGG